MAREKQVYTSTEIPHLWAHKTQQSARNQQGNFYFELPSIFSYGRHYEIARHVETKRGAAVLFNNESNSVTTNKQRNDVLRAIPTNILVFSIPELTGNYVSSNMHERSLAYYTKEIEKHLILTSRARSSYAKEVNHAHAQKLTYERNAYVKFFGLRNKPLANVPALDSDAMNEIKAKEAKRIKIQSEKEKLAKAERLLALQDQILAWRDGAGYGNFYDAPTMLRVKGDELETSRGARIPMSHAKRALTLIQAVVSRGEDWLTNGHTCHVGHYKIDRIKANGTVIAGCHVIERQEWERVAPQVEAYQAPATEQVEA